MAPTEGAGFSDDVTAEVGNDDDGYEVVAVNQESGLEIVVVPDPNDPPHLDADGELLLNGDGTPVYPGGIIHVAAPVGSTIEEAAALLGPPGDVKGPDPEVWGEEHAAAFGVGESLEPGDLTPQGLGGEVKGPDPEHWPSETAPPEE